MSMPSTNADGTAADEFTEELKFIFDTRGWIALPGVLNDDEVVEMREFSYRLQREPESIPEHHRSSIGVLSKDYRSPNCPGIHERICRVGPFERGVLRISIGKHVSDDSRQRARPL